MTEEKKLFAEPPLFGDMDGILNVIETQFTDVTNEISRRYEKMGKLKDEIKLLEKQLQEIAEARSQARKMSAAMKEEALDTAIAAGLLDVTEPEVETPEEPEKETI
jgi:phage host-nuclease inhibitor protein Gam